MAGPDILIIKNVERAGSFTTLGCLLNDKDYKEIPLSESDLDKITILSDIQHDMKGDAVKLFLGIEKKRFELASVYEPLINMQNVDPVPHQIEAVYNYIMTYHHIRHMLAHDAGAGKTIMSGLIIKELKARGAISRYCIVVPGKLMDQWKREMKDKFGEKLTPVNKVRVDEEYGDNAWNSSDAIITSMDFAKRDENRQRLGRSKKFDLVIVDEAHRMSATRQGTRTRRTERYLLGEIFSDHSRHMLFLTATPHKGDSANFNMLMDLLVPGFAGSNIMSNPHDNHIVLRRSKEQMIDMDGKKLFKKRYVITRGIELIGLEKKIYDSITNYVKDAYIKAERKKNRASLTFAMVQLQKRTASSMMAIYKTLGRRRDKLSKKLDAYNIDEQNYEIDDDYYEDMSDEDRDKALKELEGADVSEDETDLAEEINQLASLAESVKKFMDEHDEMKLDELHRLLIEIDKSEPDGKLLVFTESKETMEYITEKLRNWGYSVANIHGGMNLDTRVLKEREFKDSTRIMVATEAAGEGINLQFCHRMVNYDLPWNPNILEQRMGRIHRYGQTEPVHIWNMVAINTREGEVINTLLNKLNEIRKDMGDDVFDVIGQIISSKTLDDMFREVIAGRMTPVCVTDQIDESTNNYMQSITAYKNSALVKLNPESISKTIQRAENMGLGPTHIKKMFGIAMRTAGGRLVERNELFDVRVPRIMHDIDVFQHYQKITFNKNVAKNDSETILMSFGEPLFDKMLEWIEKECTGEFKRGAVFESYDMDGYIVFHECTIEDGSWTKIDKRMLAHYVSTNGTVELVPPYVLGNLKPLDNNSVEISHISSIENEVLKSMEKYMIEIQHNLDHNAEIKKKGLKFLSQDINELDKRQREAEGRKAENLKQDKEHKISKLNDFEQSIDLERTITPVSPKMITAVRVIPVNTTEKKEDIRDDVEQAAMLYVMKYERENGRQPVDVSKDNAGWDIESVAENGDKLLIEVKGLAGTGKVRLSWNEWKKAHEYGKSYYLYVVAHALLSDPELIIVKDPISNLKFNEEIGFSIPFKTVKDAL